MQIRWNKQKFIESRKYIKKKSKEVKEYFNIY